jgi:alpha-tubulin suppressor-like RCC1 family protein
VAGTDQLVTSSRAAVDVPSMILVCRHGACAQKSRSLCVCVFVLVCLCECEHFFAQNMADGFDVFDDDVFDAESLPHWLAATTAATPVPTGLLAQLPVEVIVGILCWLPSEALARCTATIQWLGPLVQTACIESISRMGVQMPVRRLGEGWPCVLRRAELRLASRNSAHISAGYETAAWISPTSGEPSFVRLEADPRTGLGFTPWRPLLPRPRALAVACGALHVLVLLDDTSVIILDEERRRAAEAAQPQQPQHVDLPLGVDAGDGEHANAVPSASSASTSGDRHSSCRVLRPAAPAGGERCVSIAAGAFHSLLVGEKGSLWSGGSNACGQLGIGSAEGQAYQSSTQQVACMSHHRALQASGGGHHSLVLTQTGAVLSFGHGESGQLGLGDTAVRATPTAVPLPGGSCACSVAAGGDYSLVLTEVGAVFGFGATSYAVLGRPPHVLRAQRLPARVPLPTVVRQIAAGYDHALAISAVGEVFSWGSAGHQRDQCASRVGQLGRTLRSSRPERPDQANAEPAAAAVAGAMAGADAEGEPTELDELEGAQNHYSTPAPAAAFRRCTLLAGGSFCTIGIEAPQEAVGVGGGVDAGEDDEDVLPLGVELVELYPRVVLAMSRAPKG